MIIPSLRNCSWRLAVLSVATTLGVGVAGELGPSFLEGRLVGGVAHEFHGAPFVSVDGEKPAATAWDLWRLGNEGSFESRFLFRFNYLYEPWDWELRQYGWQGELRPSSEAVIRWDWEMENAWIGHINDAGGWSHGFEKEIPTVLRQGIAFHYLQRDGRIRVEAPHYPVVFYTNPILNKKQHKWSILESHAFAGAGILADSLGIGWRYGLLNSVEFNLSTAAGRTIWLDEKWKETPWENRTRFGLTGLFGPIRVAVGGLTELWRAETEETRRTEGEFSFDGVFFGRGRVFSEVAGNWDGMFDRTAPAGQLRLSARATGWEMSEEKRGDGPDTLRLSALIGLPFGLAVDGGVLRTSDWAGGVGLSLKGMPLRTGVPERADAVEILYGTLPPPGGYLIHADLWKEGEWHSSGEMLWGLPAGLFAVGSGGWAWEPGRPAYLGGMLGWGNLHRRIQAGVQHRWKEGVRAIDGPLWRIDRHNQPVTSLYERTVGEPPMAQPGWSLYGSVRSWF